MRRYASKPDALRQNYGKIAPCPPNKKYPAGSIPGPKAAIFSLLMYVFISKMNFQTINTAIFVQILGFFDIFELFFWI